MKTTQDHKDAFVAITYQLPKAKRLEVAAQILLLKDLLGVEEDLLLDRRRLRPVRGQYSASKKGYTIEWRGSFSGARTCTIAEAAEEIGIPVPSLHAYLSHGKGTYSGVRNEYDIFTVKKIRLDADNLDEENTLPPGNQS